MSRKVLKKHYSSVFLILIFTTVIFTSELIYKVKNSPRDIILPLTKVSLDIAKIYLDIGDLEKATDYIENSAKIYIHSSQIDFPGKVPKYKPQIDLNVIDSETKEKIRTKTYYLLSKPKNTTSPLISNIFYHIGLIMYENGYHKEANNQFQTSVYLTPALSFLHVELANSYFNDGDIQSGIDALNYCMEFTQSKDHCKDYFEKNVISKQFIPVGIYKELVDEFHSKKVL